MRLVAALETKTSFFSQEEIFLHSNDLTDKRNTWKFTCVVVMPTSGRLNHCAAFHAFLKVSGQSHVTATLTPEKQQPVPAVQDEACAHVY